MKLIWMVRSREDRRAIYAYIEADNPRAAVAVDERIEGAAQRLLDFPNSGRPGRIEGTRELVVKGAPYILPYRLDGDTVRILRVIHAARLWPEEIPDELLAESERYRDWGRLESTGAPSTMLRMVPLPVPGRIYWLPATDFPSPERRGEGWVALKRLDAAEGLSCRRLTRGHRARSLAPTPGPSLVREGTASKPRGLR